MAEQTPDQRGLVGILAAVVAALLLVTRPGGGTSSMPGIAAVGGGGSSMVGDPPGTPDAPSSRPDPRAPAEQSMDALVRHYLGAEASRDSLARLLERQKATLTTLLMCVADPVSSSHGYRTDLQIETLQRALADTQHVADRWWLPWTPPAGGPTVRDGTPGLMLFRKKGPDGHTQLLAVYLVGELMTSGIDRDSLRKALTDAREVLKQAASDQRVIPILGPLFSGSTDSLALTLRDQPQEDPGVVVVNFSATAFDFPRFSVLHGRGPAVAYAATIARFDEQRDALLDYVKKTGGSTRVAWLTEVGTGLSTGALPGTGQTDQSIFTFPTGIAQVRDAYAKAAASGPRPALVSPGDRALLPFPVDAQTGARDLIPRFSAGMQGAYTELSLRHLLLDVARGDYDAVGIIATDHRDRVFLAERVRQHVPGALILLVGGDLAYDHPLHRQAMLGALVASAYPPFLAHDVWPPDPVLDPSLMERRAAAPTQANAALLNAVALGTAMARCPPEANPQGLVTSYAPPHIRLWYYDDPFRPAGPGRPPIWISTIGYQGAWPLQAVTWTGTSSVVEIKRPGSGAPQAVTQTGTGCVVGSATGPSEQQPAGRTLPGVHRNLLPLTQVVAVLLVIAVLVTVALRGGCASGDPGVRDWSASDEFVRPLAEWWSGRRVAAGSAWRLSGPLVLVLVGLWLPAATMATVTARGLIAHAEPNWDGHVATLNASPLIRWFALGTGLLAPWPVPRWLRLILVVAAVAVPLGCVPSPWLLVVAILAATATLHLLSSLMRMPWQAWTGQDVGSPAEYWLTGSAWFMTIGLLVALAGSIRDGSTHVPWLLTSAAMFNGISPLLPLTAAGVALAAIWYAELVRAWRADEYPVPSTLGVESAAEKDTHERQQEQEQEVIRYPLLGRRADAWLIDHLQGGGGRTPLGMIHFVLLLASGLWLADLARRLEPIYPEPAAHWTCVVLLITAYLSWAVVLVRTQTLIDTLFSRLNRFRREVERPGSQLRDAFPSLHRPADVGLGRLLFYRPPPSATLDDLAADPAVTLSQAQRRVIGMKRFVRSLGGQIRWLGAGLVAGAILLLVAATSLPCQPRSDLLLTSTISFVAFAWVSVRTLLRIERDSVLGLIAGSTPGRVSWDFQTVTKVALPLAVPVLLVLGQAFPDAWHWLTAIVEGWRGS